MSLIQAYALTHESSEEDLASLYDLFDTAKQQCRSQEIVLVMGDFHAKVGETKEADTTRKY